MDFLGKENYFTSLTELIGAYGVDKDVVKRINTNKCKYRIYKICYDTYHSVTKRRLVVYA